MPAQVEAVFGRNITLVYDTLDPNIVDRNQLRTIIPGTAPAIMDMPDMIVAVYQPLPLLVQIGDRRIRINHAVEIPDLGDFPIWEYARRYFDLLGGTKAALIAYGYNFDFGIILSEMTIEDLMINKFVQNRTQLEQTLQGELISFLPRITFKSGAAQYDIVFEPFQDSRVKVHGNVHLQEDGIQLPDEEGLRVSFTESYERVRTVILDLLN